LIKKKGSAIIVAMAIIAFTAVIAIGLTVATHQNIEVLSQVKSQIIIKQYENALIKKAIIQLQDNAANKKKDSALIDNLPQTITLNDAPDNITAKAYLIDAQGYFNINNLSRKKWKKIFTNLQSNVDSHLKNNEAEVNTEAIFKTLSSDDDEHAKKLFFLLPSQLRYQNLLSKHLFNQLNPYLIALPKQAKININALTPVILASLGDGLSLKKAKAFLKDHKQFDSTQAFLERQTISNANISTATVTMRSKYFLLNIIITKDHERRFAQVLLDRPSITKDKSGKISVNILWFRGG